MDIGRKEKKIPEILIVDDVDTNLMILEEIIKSMGYVPVCASDVKRASQLVEESLPQLILLDIFMPGISGFEFCEKLKKNVRTRDIPVIFISAATGEEDKRRGLELGAVDFITKPFEAWEVITRVNLQLKMYQMTQELEANNKYLHLVIENQMKRIEEEQRNILYALAVLADEEQEEKQSRHLDHVGYNSRLLAQSLQLSPEFEEDISENFIEKIGIAAMLHDIGRLRAADATRGNPLVDDESIADKINIHAEQGARILEQIYKLTHKNDFLAMAIDIARYHHARYDGIGCPRGVKGKDIPLAARIVSVVDFFDVITGDFRDQISEEEGNKIIKKRAGSYYDPEIVHIFMKVRKQMKRSNVDKKQNG